MQEVECTVTGRVQMVMYRDFAKRHAKRSGLTGTVQNFSDGSVRVLAQGTKEQLAVFIKTLEEGPLLSKVKQVDVTWRLPTQTFQTFSIL